MTKINEFPWYQRPGKIIYRYFIKKLYRDNYRSDRSCVDPLKEIASLQCQLNETQQLLEYYFKRSETLESELLKYNK